jgi:hypothetical protein
MVKMVCGVARSTEPVLSAMVPSAMPYTIQLH